MTHPASRLRDLNGPRPTNSDAFRLYAPEDCTGKDGYPQQWHDTIKHAVREQADYRCVRCGHRYVKGGGKWSPCDERCTHAGPVRVWMPEMEAWAEPHPDVGPQTYPNHPRVEAAWRVLTVHHLDGNKGNCRWWNLTSLCQRCHLQIQGRVKMERTWPWEHSAWFQPYVAGYYALTYLGQEISREEAVQRLDELLALERVGA